MINIGILSSSLRQRHFQHSNLGGWIDYREISGRGLVRRCRPYMFASLSKLHPSKWEVLGFEAQHGKFPLNRQIHSFRFKMLAQIFGSKLTNNPSNLMCYHPGKYHQKYRQGIASIAYKCFWEHTSTHLRFAGWPILFRHQLENCSY